METKQLACIVKNKKKSALLVLQTKQEQLNGLLETQASMVDTSDVAIRIWNIT